MNIQTLIEEIRKKRSRKIKMKFTREMVEDLKVSFGLDITKQLEEQLVEELKSQFNIGNKEDLFNQYIYIRKLSQQNEIQTW
jgi:hypothetical protein